MSISMGNVALAWLKASRLASQSYIALPLIVGQVCAWSQTGEWNWPIFVLVQLFGLFDQLYIVYANDYADRETDAHNETWTIFSGGSRVLVDGTLRPKSLFVAAMLMAALCLVVGLVLAVGWGRGWAPVLIVTGLALLWMYSFEPVRLSYRGGGELLQMLGVGTVLPLLGYYAQAGTLDGFVMAVMVALVPLQFTCAMCTALPDEPSDRASGKRTTTVLLGNTAAKATIVGLGAAALCGFALVAPREAFAGVSPWYLVGFPLGVSALMAAVAPGAVPGSKRLWGFVFLGILVNLSFQGMVVGAWLLT